MSKTIEKLYTCYHAASFLFSCSIIPIFLSGQLYQIRTPILIALGVSLFLNMLILTKSGKNVFSWMSIYGIFFGFIVSGLMTKFSIFLLPIVIISLLIAISVFFLLVLLYAVENKTDMLILFFYPFYLIAATVVIAIGIAIFLLINIVSFLYPKLLNSLKITRSISCVLLLIVISTFCIILLPLGSTPLIIVSSVSAGLCFTLTMLTQKTLEFQELTKQKTQKKTMQDIQEEIKEFANGNIGKSIFGKIQEAFAPLGNDKPSIR